MKPTFIDQVISFDDQPVPMGKFVTPPDRLLKGDPKQAIATYVEGEEGRLIAGMWQSEPGKWKAVPGRREFCYIICGDVVISDAKGGRKRYKAGDSFMLPYGFDGYWEVLETCQKYYVILQD